MILVTLTGWVCGTHPSTLGSNPSTLAIRQLKKRKPGASPATLRTDIAVAFPPLICTLADSSQSDMLGVRYKSVNCGGTNPSFFSVHILEFWRYTSLNFGAERESPVHPQQYFEARSCHLPFTHIRGVWGLAFGV